MLEQFVRFECGIEVIFVSASPIYRQSINSPQYHCSAARYSITLLQQLADLFSVSHFAAVCTAFTLHCAVALLIGKFNQIDLFKSQVHVVCWSLLLQISSYYYYNYNYYHHHNHHRHNHSVSNRDL
jgi:hypothetical protein